MLFQIAVVSGLLAAACGSAPVAYTAPVVAAKLEQLDSFPQYRFGYSVADSLSGDYKSQQEQRDGDLVQGSYSVVEPDGTRRVVEYAADAVNGFNAVVRKEPLVAAAPAVVAEAVAPARIAVAGPVGAAPVQPLVAQYASAPAEYYSNAAVAAARFSAQPAPFAARYAAAPVALAARYAAAPVLAGYAAAPVATAARYAAAPVVAGYAAAPVAAAARYAAAPVVAGYAAAPVATAARYAAAPVAPAVASYAAPVLSARYAQYALPAAYTAAAPARAVENVAAGYRHP